MQIPTVFFLSILAGLSLVQGQCSDAGVCSIGSASTYPAENTVKIDAGYSYGISSTVEDVDFHTVYLKGTFLLSQTGLLFIRWNVLNRQIGPLGTVSGIGDLLLIYKQILWERAGSVFSLSAGLKLATGNANANPDLPQVYQPGLGTNDLLFGLNYQINTWQFLLGYQYTQRIRNANKVNRLKRGDDLYAELAYTGDMMGGQVIFKLMGIKRLQESEISDGSGGFVIVDGSAQTQVNAAANYTYRLSHGYAVSAEAALPILKRKINVDGLTRHFTFSVQISKNL